MQSLDTRNRSKKPEREEDKDLLRFTVSYTWECPVYQKGDMFELRRNFLLPPPHKPICLILSDTFKQKKKLLENHRLSGSDLDFMCSGCGRRNSITLNSVSRKAIPSEVEMLTECLHKFSFFRVIPHYIVAEIYNELSIDHYNAGDVIIERGSMGKALYIVVSGEVEVQVGKSSTAVATHGVGGVFGEMSLLSGNKCNATICATKETRLLTIRADTFNFLIKRFPELQRYFYRLLSNRFNKTNIDAVKHEITEIHGKLSEWHLPDLLQTINMNAKTGRLEINIGASDCYIDFVQGNITAAHYKNSIGHEAFFSLFAEPEGEFRFIPETIPQGEQIMPMGDFMYLMMEGLVRADQAALNHDPAIQ